MKLVFATNNQHKLKEIQHILGSELQLLSLYDINCHEEIPEDHPTIEANAMQKAEYVYNKYNYNCFADDTGLEIDALNGKPGVFSARYAGEDKNSEANIRKVLQELSGLQNRGARFKTVIALIINGKKHLFEGIVKGTILHDKHGTNGFGYDPIFKPAGYEKTFAEMTDTEKNAISHRALAIHKLSAFFKKHSQTD